MSGELSGYSIKQPLQSAPLTGEIMAVDLVNRVCTVQVQSQVVDNVTWFGIEPLVGEIVYLTDAGDRMIAVAAGDADHAHSGYLTPAEVLAGTNVSVTQNPDGTVTIAAADANFSSMPTAWRSDAVLIDNWNNALFNGFYMSAPGAANVPASSLGASWWYGETIAHNAIWCLQRAWAFAAGYPSGIQFERWQANGAWTAWRRTNNYIESYGSLDGLVFHDHDGSRRFASGLKSAEDEWRVQCYSGGNYTRSGIRVVQDGRVLMPYTMQSGADSITPVANQNTTKRINFDTPFTTTPQVQITVISGVTGDTVKGWAATGVDTSGFTMNIHRINTTSTSFMWTATAD